MSICIKAEHIDILPQARRYTDVRAGRNASRYCSPMRPAATFLTTDGQNVDGGRMSIRDRSLYISAYLVLDSNNSTCFPLSTIHPASRTSISS